MINRTEFTTSSNAMSFLKVYGIGYFIGIRRYRTWSYHDQWSLVILLLPNCLLDTGLIYSLLDWYLSVELLRISPLSCFHAPAMSTPAIDSIPPVWQSSQEFPWWKLVYNSRIYYLRKLLMLHFFANIYLHGTERDTASIYVKSYASAFESYRTVLVSILWWVFYSVPWHVPGS